METKSDTEYFFGSLVFQTKPVNKSEGRDFEESDLLDGQWHLTTLLLLMVVLRDLAQDTKLKNTCQGVTSGA